MGKTIMISATAAQSTNSPTLSEKFLVPWKVKTKVKKEEIRTQQLLY